MITIEFGAVYKIENKLNHKVYIGQTRNFNRRKKYHLDYLKHNRHHNTALQEDYNKYGLVNFEFSIIEYNEVQSERIKRETYWINYYGGMNSLNVYNKVDNEHNCLEQIEATKISNKNRILSQTTLDKMSLNNKGCNNPYYNHRKYNDDIIKELKFLHEKGLSYAKLEKQFNINQRVIRNLIKFGRCTNPKVAEYKKAKRRENKLYDNN